MIILSALQFPVNSILLHHVSFRLNPGVSGTMWSLKLDLRRKMQPRTPWWHTKLLS